MSDVKDFEIGYRLYNVGEWSDEQEGKGFLKPRLFRRIGWTSIDVRAINLSFRAANHNLPASLPSFRVRKGRHLGLLAMPSGLADIIQSDYPGVEVRRAIISTARDGRTIAGPLPEDVRPGLARLISASRDGFPRFLALPMPEGISDINNEEAPGPLLETVFCRLPQKGATPAAFGFIVGQSLALPNPSTIRDTAPGMAPTAELMAWVRASNTPIASLF